jgi:hypothetical protein
MAQAQRTPSAGAIEGGKDAIADRFDASAKTTSMKVSCRT